MNNKKTTTITILILLLIVGGSFILSNPAITGNVISSDKQILEELRGLPYLNHVANEQGQEKSGVTIYNKEKASPGLNVYSSRESPEIYLTDLNGNILHKWTPKNYKKNVFSRIDKDSNLISFGGGNLIKLKWNSNIIWEHKGGSFHHEATLNKENIYSLTHESKVIDHQSKKIVIGNRYE